MSDKKNSNKKLIFIAVALVAVIIVLVVIVLLLNKDDPSDELITADSSANNTVTQAIIDNTSVSGETDKVTVADDGSDKVISDVEKNTDDKATGDKNVAEKEDSVISLGDYLGVKAKYESHTITDEIIDENLEYLLNQNIKVVDLPNRAFEEGDMAIVNFEGQLDGERVDSLSGICFQDIIGAGYMPEEIEDAIIGKHIGDTFVVSIDYPENLDGYPEIAGKTVNYVIELENGFAYEIPDINDAFIREVTEYNSLEEYRRLEKERLQKEADEEAYNQMLMDIKRTIVDSTFFSEAVTTEIKKRYLARLQEDKEKYYQEYMMDAATFFKLAYDISLEEYQNSVMDEVSLEVKFESVLDEVIKKEHITGSDDVTELRQLAQQLIIDNSIIEK